MVLLKKKKQKKTPSFRFDTNTRFRLTYFENLLNPNKYELIVNNDLKFQQSLTRSGADTTVTANVLTQLFTMIVVLYWAVNRDVAIVYNCHGKG